MDHPFRDDLLIAFCGNPLDRAEDKRGDAAWLAEAARRGRFLVVHENRIRMRIGETLDFAWLDHEAARPLVDTGADCVLLGLDGRGVPHFALAAAEADAAEGIRYIDGRSLGLQLAQPEIDAGRTGIAAQALAILSWHARHRHCARCGAMTIVRRGGYQRFCEPCATEHFPRTDPVAIMLVTDGDRCLLGRQAHWPDKVFSALAGFVEAGETFEAAVRREVHEEAGIRVGRIAYVASQPWPFPSNLMLGCLAEALTDDILLDEAELSEARWFSSDEVRAAFAGESPILTPPPPIAIAHHLMKRWLDAACN